MSEISHRWAMARMTDGLHLARRHAGPHDVRTHNIMSTYFNLYEYILVFLSCWWTVTNTRLRFDSGESIRQDNSQSDLL